MENANMRHTTVGIQQLASRSLAVIFIPASVSVGTLVFSALGLVPAGLLQAADTTFPAVQVAEAASDSTSVPSVDAGQRADTEDTAADSRQHGAPRVRHLPQPEIDPATRAAQRAEAYRRSFESGAQVPTVPAPLTAKDPRTKALVARVQALWEKKAARDFASMYEFESPEYRADVDAETFARRFGAFVQWHGIDVIGVEYGDDGLATVELLLDHTFTSPLDDTSHRTKTYLTEHWVETSGEWYHVTARHDSDVPPFVQNLSNQPDGPAADAAAH